MLGAGSAVLPYSSKRSLEELACEDSLSTLPLSENKLFSDETLKLGVSLGVPPCKSQIAPGSGIFFFSHGCPFLESGVLSEVGSSNSVEVGEVDM